MKAKQALDEFLNKIGETKQDLLHEEERLLRQKTFFKYALERAEMLQDETDIEKSKKGLKLINSKLDDIQAMIGDLETKPSTLAQQVVSEAEAFLDHLTQEAQEQRAAVEIAKINLMAALTNLASLKSEADKVVHNSSHACLLLRRNPLESFKINGQHAWVVDLETINKLLRI